MLHLRGKHPSESVALVSHGDIIKAALAYFLGVPLDLFLRIEVDPASISIVALTEAGPRIIRVNG
jgi:probable phosphoglycerate mutase